MANLHERRMPGESEIYRAARNELLELERDLRARVEAVAEKRRALPVGGAITHDYVFQEAADDGDTERDVKLSELFAAGLDILLVYSLMFAPDDELACPMCTAFLDSFDRAANQAGERINIVVVAKAPIKKIRAWAKTRGWSNLRLLSSGTNSFNLDYFTEGADGDQWSTLNVFRRTGDGIAHSYNAELSGVPNVDGSHPRHVDMMWPLWNILDLTPEGRGSDWYPSL